jgi:hypothetical protein
MNIGSHTHTTHNHDHTYYKDSVELGAIQVADAVILVKGNKIAVIKDRNGEFSNIPGIKRDEAIVTAIQQGSHKHSLRVSGSDGMFFKSDISEIIDIASEMAARSFSEIYNMDNNMFKELIKYSVREGIIKGLKNFEVKE